MSEQIFRYVTWPDVDRSLREGWAFAADLGQPHANYSCLMVFLCCCGREAK